MQFFFEGYNVICNYVKEFLWLSPRADKLRMMHDPTPQSSEIK